MARSLKRFFTSQTLDGKKQKITLGPDEAKHLERVLRLKEEDSCVIFDSTGNVWLAKVAGTGKKGTEVALIEPISKPGVGGGRILNVVQAIPQRGKMDLIAEKAAELGVSKLIPLVTDRTIVRMKASEQEKVVSRWTKITQEARKQSHSKVPTEIIAPVAFEKLFELIPKTDLIFLFDPRAQKSIKEILKQIEEDDTVWILIGPEGGFTELECGFAADQGATIVKLGETVLKTDTAFVAITSAFQYLS